MLFSVPAWSQVNIDSAIRETTHPISKKVKELLEAPPKGKIPEILLPEKVEEVTSALIFFIKEIILEGVESFSADEFDHIIEKHKNKEGSLETIQALTREIESEYLKKGIIAACLLPPQNIEDGIIRLQVIETKMGNLTISSHKYFRESRLEKYWKPEKGNVLRYDDIARSLYLMNKNPDREVKSVLKAGEEVKTTDVYLEAKTHFPIHLTTFVDREGTVSTGRIRQNYGIKHNNLLGLDDTLLGGFSFGNEFESIYVYHSIPITSYGTTLLYGYSYNRSFPGKEFKPLDVESSTRNSTVQIRQDIFKGASYRGEVYLAFDAKDKHTKTVAGTLNRDRLRILTIGNRYLIHKPGQYTLINPQISQGLYAFGAKKRDALTSRFADPRFTKFNLNIDHRRQFSNRLQVNLGFAWQIASTRLAPQEGYFLGGIDSVRGYPSGDFTGDNAVQFNLELRAPALFIPKRAKLPWLDKTIRDIVTPLAFFDYGWGKKRYPSPSEKETANLRSLGAGFRFAPTDKMLIRTEWGFPIGDKTITETASSRFHFSVNFDIPF